MKTCAFTGHRPKGLGYPESDERCAALKEKIRSLIVKLTERCCSTIKKKAPLCHRREASFIALPGYPAE